MHELKIHIRSAIAQDQERILSFLDRARHRYLSFGREDLPDLLTQPGHTFVLADVGTAIWGIACATLRSRPAAPGEPTGTTWGYLRGLALASGWRAEVGVPTLLEGLSERLHAHRVAHLVVYATQPWMVPPLREAGLSPQEYIITYERVYDTHPTLPVCPGVQLRPACAEDVRRLTELDATTFPSLWRLASGEMIELLIISGYFLVAEREGELIGYVCGNVRHGVGQIYRLAVGPEEQGRGIGRLLLANALSYCQTNGASSILINTLESNQAADRLYRHFGFRPVLPRVPVMVGDLAGTLPAREAET